MEERAFPLHVESDKFDDFTVNEGMSLRDYFAAKAMAALLGKVPIEKLKLAECGPTISARAYSMADDMLEARAE